MRFLDFEPEALVPEVLEPDDLAPERFLKESFAEAFLGLCSVEGSEGTSS